MAQTLVNPRGIFQRACNPIAPRPDSLDHKVLGIVDNGKVNADLFLENIVKRLRETYSITKVIKILKSRVGTPAVFSEAFFQECDVAVNAFGD
jgi:hypothetical protein